jgi:hypothetical protein
MGGGSLLDKNYDSSSEEVNSMAPSRKISAGDSIQLTTVE